jgi:hypothetical protein
MLMLASLGALGLAIELRAAESTLPPVSERFAGQTDAVPDFQRHVLPLLGRLGCNGRACHGSFQGQGGFRLSLFGYDFAADHAALIGGETPRVDLKDVTSSLILRKPTLADEHDGGKRLDVDSWSYRLLQRWIEAGAPTVAEDAPEFAALEVEPQEIAFSKIGETATLRVMARWSDGTREDVTPLCRFRSNDEAIATIDEAGRVTAVTGGDTSVVAFYDNGVVPVATLLPLTDRIGPNYPDVAAPTKIDELVVAKLKKLGVVPSELCSDAEFLRRASLDITGMLPTPPEVEAFLANKSKKKRAAKIDELLERPGYAAWWANRISEWTGNSGATGPLGGERGLNDDRSRQWYRWIHRRVADNVPYDDLVAGIVLAVSRGPEQSYEDYFREMAGYFRTEQPVDFAERETMPHFWSRRNVGKPEAKALSFAYAFLGLSLQCAECHKHPFDQWTKQDFDQFAAFFNGIRFSDVGQDRKLLTSMRAELKLVGDEDSGAYRDQVVKLAQAGTVQPFKEVTVPRPKKASVLAKASSKAGAKGSRVITPRLLGGEEVVAAAFDDPRQPVMDWMREADNPYFARAFVNRVWAGYFHAGIIEPTDDLNLANPPSNPALLDYLTAEFIRSGYDMKRLHREIANSHAYQRSRRPNDTNRLDERNFSRAVLRRLPAEALYDAVAAVTASAADRRAMDDDPLHRRSSGLDSGLFGSKNEGTYTLALFGKAPRTVNCDCERSLEPSLLQTVYLRNDYEMWNRLTVKKGWLAEVAKSKPADRSALVREAYLRTLNRLPTEAETATSLEHLAAAEKDVLGLHSLLWALMNTKEFLLNH